ncbi:coth-domain-containing protein [Neocallimastix lanati (nom. inval.)]|jgi:hypothetical protein|nr:coth-domain-containing protein [Neocallimastix sp. JGI-2020a]
MKILFLLRFLLSYVLIVFAADNYLKDLDRSFDEAENKIVDLYVSIPKEEVNNLIKITQISLNQVQNGGAKNLADFKYVNTTILAKWNGKEKKYENCSFKTGGQYARSNDKVSFNIKLEKKFLGRKNIRLRPDATDKSHLRSKICCDIANRMGVPSIQAVYARLYMNNEYWGLYTLMDALKPSWIKQTFNPTEKEVTTLYQCKNGGMNLKSGSASKCFNANDEYQHMTQLNNFVKGVNEAKNINDLSKIMDVNVFLKYVVFEWLIGSFDHFLIYGHNFYFYKRETDGKWLLIEHDFDNTFGSGISLNLWANKGPNQDGSSGNSNNNNNNNPWGWGWGFGGNNNNNRGSEPIKYSFADWEMNIPILKTLVYNNKDNFKKIVREVLVSAFNPTILDPHINELKKFLTPYVKEDSTKGKDGSLPGRINKKGQKHSSSVSEFENNIETSLKYWIKTKFEVACNQYGFSKTEILNEASSYVAKPFDYGNNSKQKQKEEEAKKKQEEEEAKKKQEEEEAKKKQEEEEAKKKQEEETKKKQEEEEAKKKQEEEAKKKQEEEAKKKQEEEEAKKKQEEQKEKEKETTKAEEENDDNIDCWSEILGYSCCKETCKTKYTDKHGNWGVENKQWCGIIDEKCKKSLDENKEKEKEKEKETSKTEEENDDIDCWSEILGYSCCKKTCKTKYSDKHGNWGVENKQWCGIIDEKCKKILEEAKCYGETTGEYSCCEKCKVRYSDKHGDWGIENKEWCSIKYTCKNEGEL